MIKPVRTIVGVTLEHVRTSLVLIVVELPVRSVWKLYELSVRWGAVAERRIMIE